MQIIVQIDIRDNNFNLSITFNKSKVKQFTQKKKQKQIAKYPSVLKSNRHIFPLQRRIPIPVDMNSMQMTSFSHR